MTLDIAIWDAILSTILAFRNVLRNKRKIHVTCLGGNIYKWFDNGKNDSLILIKAINTGHRDVRLERARLITNKGNKFIPQIEDLPLTLSDGEYLTIRINPDHAEGQLKEFSTSKIYVSAFVVNTEGKYYKTYQFPDFLIQSKLAKKSWGLKRHN